MVRVIGAGVEEDGVDFPQPRGRLHDLVPHGRVDDGVHLAGQHRLDGAGLDIGVALGVDDHQRHARRCSDLVGTVNHQAAKGVEAMVSEIRPMVSLLCWRKLRATVLAR